MSGRSKVPDGGRRIIGERNAGKKELCGPKGHEPKRKLRGRGSANRENRGRPERESLERGEPKGRTLEGKSERMKRKGKPKDGTEEEGTEREKAQGGARANRHPEEAWKK